MNNTLSGFFANTNNISLVLTIVVALLQCFMGYKLIRFWSSLAGFACGALLAWIVCSNISFLIPWAKVLIVALVGLLGAWVAYKLYILGVFFTIFSAAYTALGIFCNNMHFTEPWLSWALPIVAIVLGILGCIFARPYIICATGISGASSAANAAQLMVGFATSVVCIAFVVLAVLGILVQFKTTTRNKHEL